MAERRGRYASRAACGLGAGSAGLLLGTTTREGSETVSLGRRNWLNTARLLFLRAVVPSTMAALRRGASLALFAAAGTTASLLPGWRTDSVESQQHSSAVQPILKLFRVFFPNNRLCDRRLIFLVVVFPRYCRRMLTPFHRPCLGAFLGSIPTLINYQLSKLRLS